MTDRPIRVLHFVAKMRPGGIENWLMQLLRNADRSKVVMDICVSYIERGVYDDEIESMGVKIIRCPIKPIFTYQGRLKKILRYEKYDVVHLHSWLFNGLLVRTASICNVPVRIAYCHTTRSRHRKTLYRVIYGFLMRKLIHKYSTHCLGCCKEASAALFGKNWQHDPKCKVLYTSIDEDAFRPSLPVKVSKSEFGIPDNARVIGHVGSFRMAKNHPFLLDIAKEIISRDSNTWFFLAGDGLLRPEMEEKAEKLGIKDKVVFAGNRKDVPQLMMNLFDILLFPSIYEGMPLTLVESAAAGLRAVCSDVISKEATDVMPEVFSRLSLDLTAKDWADEIEKVFEKGKVTQEEAYELISNSHFSTTNSLQELYNIYRG